MSALWPRARMLERTAKESLRGRAYQQMRDAFSVGEIVRSFRCSRCDCGGRILAHHENYLRPCDVTWLCGSCHWRRHREMARAGITPYDGIDMCPWIARAKASMVRYTWTRPPAIRPCEPTPGEAA